MRELPSNFNPFKMSDDKQYTIDQANDLRAEFKIMEEKLRAFSNFVKSANQEALHDKGECIANSVLAIRHCEDARMRLGKVIQYATTGVSSFDTNGGAEAQQVK